MTDFKTAIYHTSFKAIFCTLALLLTAGTVTASAASPDTLSDREKYGEKLTELVRHFQAEGYEIEGLLEDERFEIYERIDRRFTGSAERKSPDLDEYKQILQFDDKAERIAQFHDEHVEPLHQAEATYGISQYVIAAIIGIESDFGTKTGRYNPFNAYVSMFVADYRAEFALAQLEELLEFTGRRDLDVMGMKSSYAGAVSPAQFIPYSLNRWFVGDDLEDMANSILSVGKYLAYFMERTGDLRTSVIRYNPSSLYADTVLDLAREAEEIIESRPSR
ncbi:MAG: lytic murein transglycosylase [Balneolaceae bacterium]|nr:lytic murein transglycosylase [Balneolaceae bacterium]